MHLQLAKLTEQLGIMFDKFNDVNFNGELVKPIITIQSGEKQKAYGWCSVGYRWVNEVSQEKYYEINLSAEYIHRPYLEVAQTLYHEMIHLYNQQHYIIDCSKNGKHLKRFATTCEQFGLNCSQNEKGSWTITSFTNELKHIADSIEVDKSLFIVKRISTSKPNEKKERVKRIKMECSCGNQISCKTVLDITCNVCNSKFEVVG